MDLRFQNLDFSANYSSNAFSKRGDSMQNGGCEWNTDTVLRLDSLGSSFRCPPTSTGVKRKHFISGCAGQQFGSSLSLGFPSSSSSHSEGSSATACTAISSAKENDEVTSTDLDLHYRLHLGTDDFAAKADESKRQIDLESSLSTGPAGPEITNVCSPTARSGEELLLAAGVASSADEGSTSPWKSCTYLPPLHSSTPASTGFFLNSAADNVSAVSVPKESSSVITASSSSVTYTSGITKKLQPEHCNNTKTCQVEGCGQGARGASGRCISHGGGGRCQKPGCHKGAEGRTVFCKAHGGGRRCEFLGCIKSAEGRTDFCITHGGGRRCTHEGCARAARGKSGLCIRHGGGKRCQKENCTHSAQGLSGLCISHGGGCRCQYVGCTKGAQGSTMFCKAHGGGKRCTYMGCTKGAEGSTFFCRGHGGGKRCSFKGGGVCTKSVHGGTNFCVAHGARKRCAVPECTKSARGRTDFCVRHGGSKKYKFEGSGKSAQGSTDFCKAHGGGKRGSWGHPRSEYGSQNTGPCNSLARGKTGLCAFDNGLLQDKRVPVKLTGKLRQLCNAEIVSVGPAKEEKKDDQEEEENNKKEESKDNKKGDDKDKKGGEQQQQPKVDTCLQDKTGDQSKLTRVTEDQSTIVDHCQSELDDADPELKGEKQNAPEGGHQQNVQPSHISVQRWYTFSGENDTSLDLSYLALLRKKGADQPDTVQREYMKKQSKMLADVPCLADRPRPIQDAPREGASLKDKVGDQSEQTRGSEELSITEIASTELDIGDTKKFPELKYKEQNAPEGSHQKNIQASCLALEEEDISLELSLGPKNDSKTSKKLVGKAIPTPENSCKMTMETTSEQICRDTAVDEMSSLHMIRKQQEEGGLIVMGDNEACKPGGAEESDCSTSESEYEDIRKVRRNKYKKKKASEGSQQDHSQNFQISEQNSHDSSKERSILLEIPFCEAKQQREQSKGLIGANYDLIAGRIVEKLKMSDAGKIGIHGRDAVNKRNVIEALSKSEKLKTLFNCVILVKMATSCDIKMAQLKIAQEIFPQYMDAHEDEISQRVAHLLKSMKFLLIFDDIPMNLDLKAMKIPMPTSENGSKMILVTASEQICNDMAADEVVNLDDELSWDLFCRNASELVHSADIQPIAREIVKLCNHCSRAIVLMARALKNECEYAIWIVARNKLLLEVGSDGEVEDIMSAAVEFSFESIDDELTIKCLKNIALDENEVETTKESLVCGWIQDGLVSTINEGHEVLKNLIDLNLLEIDEQKDVVILRDLDRDIFVNFVVRPEESSMFVMKGGLGLVEPPDDDEWEIAKEISLMQNEIFKLPESPLCPSLSALFLQRNQKLRVIPPPFFLHMPSLQVLNLSKTRIRSLPESFFQLSSLKRLFLRECILLRRLPAEIRNLKELEVLDLEGTKLVALPAAVGELENLTCLEVSISESENHKETTKGSPIIPCEVVSTLSHLEELNIGIDPEAEWWGSCVECIINEICSLKKLDKLNFYFPNKESLNHFNQLWRSTEHQALSQFHFIIGRHAKSIMSQIPTDAELELERWSKCLKYINGVGVHDDIKEILSDSEAFFLERNSNVKKLSEFGVECLQHMKCCVLGGCNELTELVDGADLDEGDDFGKIESNSGRIFLGSLEYLYVYYMKNLTTIWKGAPSDGSLLNLKCLTLKTCPRLTCVFTECLLGNLCNLEELVVDDCPAIVSLVTCEDVSSVKTSVFLPMLRRIILHYVPELTSISSGLRIAPKLELLSFYNCEKLKSLSVEEVSSRDLRKIRGKLSWWKELQWLGGDRPDALDGIFVPVDILEVP